jgi:hypothetical protein
LTQTNTKGTPSILVNALQLRVNCVISSVANLVAPAQADRTINLFLGPKEIDFSAAGLNPATQTPTCGYTWTAKTYTWTGISSFNYITTATSSTGHANGLLKLNYITDPVNLASSPIATTLKVTYTYSDYLGASRTIDTNTLSFDILIVSPCQSTAFTAVSYTLNNAAFTFGASAGATTDFTDGDTYTYQFTAPNA